MTHPASGRHPIVVAFDGSDEALRAIETAGRVMPGAAAIVVHVGSAGPIAPPAAGAPLLPPLPGTAPVEDADVERIAKEVADAGVRAAEAVGLRAEPATSRGDGASDVAHAIVDVARKHDAALIVVGSRGRSGVKAALLGSVSSALLGIASIPVLVVPPTEEG
jgi:nucleotide-binding universal stress UspA family protein